MSFWSDVLNVFTGGLVTVARQIRKWLTPKMPKMPGAKAGEVKLPDIGTGEVIPILMGTRKLAGTVVWWGDVRTTQIIKGKQHRQHIANWYSLGMHILLAKRVDHIAQIYAGDVLVYNSIFNSGTINLTGRNQFGGFDVDHPGGEGGLDGWFQFLSGDSSQGVNSYLYNQLGHPTYMPAFRGVASLIWQGIYGVQPAPRMFSFVCGNFYNTLGVIPANIGQDMNPAHMLHFLYVQKEIAAGILATRIDTASFISCGVTLQNEGFGLSIVIENSNSIEDIEKDILRHIDGDIYRDSITGLFTMVLNRQPDLSLIPTFSRSEGVKSLDSFSRITPESRVNEVVIGYTSREKYERDIVTSQNAAVIYQSQRTISQTIDYDGITTPELAARVGARDLKALSSPIADVSLTGDRRLSNLRPGNVFRLTFADAGIANIILRVKEIDLGTLVDGIVRVKASEDVFNIDQTALITPPPTEWTPPGSAPTPFDYTVLIELPFHLLYLVDEITPLTIDYAACFIGAAGVPADGNQMYANLYSQASGSYANEGSLPFCATGVSPFAVLKTETIITVDAAEFFEFVSVGDLAIWDDEIVRVDLIGSGTVTFGRGCIDTVPAEHSANSRIFFLHSGFGSDSFSYSSGSTVRVRGVTTTIIGQLDIASAPTATLTAASRQGRPYVPGRFRINGGYYPASIDVGADDIVVTWNHRDRISQYDNAVISSAETYSGAQESGVTYTAELRRADNNVLLADEQGITDTTWTFTNGDLGGYTGDLRVVLFSVRDGYESWQKHSHDFEQL